MKSRICIVLACLSFYSLQAQDTSYARTVIDRLTSKEFFGRGYVNKGLAKSAAYLEGEMKNKGLLSFGKKGYRQNFSMPVNTFPGKMEVTLDGRLLKPGIHYILSPESKGFAGHFDLQKKDSATYLGVDAKRRMVAVSLQKKLTFSVAPEPADYLVIELLKDSFPGPLHALDVNIENKAIPAFKTANLCGYIRGSAQPDSFLVFTAHYDHLGGMGRETYFPGANDNASGVSMLLDLMNYYTQHPPKYSIAFLFFSGEEAGLVGSKYYTEHPLFPLSQIRFLLNLDLLGTGDEGITVVNATEYKGPFDRLKAINDTEHLLNQVKPRGKVRNSDHYWFTEKGVPCFFIYTMGGIKAYHDVQDVSRTLPLTRYREVFQLLTRFSEGF